ncbi:MAG: peptidyl-prolyl cis-trans isomerase [Terriglobia bacterium]
MLKLFRERKLVVKLMLWVIVSVVGLMMVVTLVPGLGGGCGAGTDPLAIVARVGEGMVTAQAVQRRLLQVQALGGQTNPFFRRLLAEQVINDLIFQQAVEQEAEQLGLQMTPEEVSAEIRPLPLFSPEGEFVGTALYQQIVQQQLRTSVEEFEEGVRVAGLANKLYQLLTDGLQVTEAEIEQEFRARNETVAVEYALFKPRAVEGEIQASEEDLRAFFTDRRSRYTLPERRRVRYVAVNFAWVEQRAPVTRAELEVYYQRNRERYRVPEQVRFRHILFRFPDDATEEQKEEVRAQARRVRAELVRGKKFAALAQGHSGDAATAEKGGDVGWIRRGQVVPTLEAVVFGLEKGALSEPVEVGYGIHIVRLTDHQQARLKPFAEVRAEIEAVVGPQKSEQEALRLAQQMVQAVRSGSTLAAAAEALGLGVARSSLFGLRESLPEFAGTTSFQEAAFRLKPEEVSEPVSVPTGYAVLQLLEVSQAHPAEFDEVRDEVERAFRQERAAAQAQERAQSLAKATQQSGNLRAAARTLNAEVKLSQPFARTDSVADLGPAREFAAAVFTVPVGSVAGPVQVGLNWAVLRVAVRKEADLEALENERALIAAQLLQQKRQMTFQLFRESLIQRLTATGELQKNQRAIDRLLGTS